MAIERISEIQLGDMLLVFEQETDFKRVGFYMMPAGMAAQDVCDRKFYRVNSLAQLKLMGDIYPNCYGNGQTMHNCETANLFEYDTQTVESEGEKTYIRTVMRDHRGYDLVNVITWYQGRKL